MYRNKRYRIGAASRANASAISDSSTISTISNAANPPLTSTPRESNQAPVQPQPQPDNDANENENILNASQSVYHSASQATPHVPNKVVSNDNDFQVPASQFIQQSRYISQRSVRLRTQLSMTQQTPMSYFESVLSRCGVEVTARNSEVSYTLNCDHLKFVIRLRKELMSHSKYPENVQNFLGGLVDSMRNQMQLVKVLSGCMITLPNSETSKVSQESLMNDFLMIDFMQKDIIEILMNKIKVLVVDDSAMSQMEINLLLAQLKFVDHLSHGDFVCDKMFEILELASGDIQEVIIKSVEDIVDLTRHNDVIEKLIQLLPEDAQFLTENNIDTFGNMCLSAQSHLKICKKIIRYIKTDAPNSLLPCFTRFILKFNSEEVGSLPEIIENLRSCLRWPQPLATTKNAIQKNQKEVFGCVNRSLIRSRQLFDVWLKRIQSIMDEHKPIDLIILLMMMTINDEKSTYIENIIRRKLKADHIQVKLLEETVETLPTTLLEYSKVLFELFDSFVRDKNPAIATFANVGYRLVFGIESCDRKVLLMRLVGFVCERNAHAMALADSGLSNAKLPSNDITTSALMILSEINQKHPKEMKHNGLQILRLIDYSGDFSLTQYRLVMNILCSIAYSEPSCEQLKDNIDMLVKKQVSSSIRNVKNRGIISVVRVIDHMVWERAAAPAGDDDPDCSFSTIESLPTKLAKIAANYIELACTSSQNCPKHLALFLDELSSVFLHRNDDRRSNQTKVNRPFLIWLLNLITEHFEKNFIVEEMPAATAHFQLQVMRSLNKEEEMSVTEGQETAMIAINVAGTTLNSSPNAMGSATILASLFNLMRVLYFHRFDRQLTCIDAVLGAGVVLPHFMAPDSTVDIFDELDEDRLRQVIDMYFYTVNLFRELISAYVSQNEESMRRKVLTRLYELIELEQKIKDVLAKAPDDYVPPTCVFLTEQSVSRANVMRFKKSFATKKAASKRKKPTGKPDPTQATQPPSTAANQTVAEVTIPPTGRGNLSKKRSYDVTNNLNEFLRSMDADIIQLLAYDLKLEMPLAEADIGKYLGLLEFKFLMEDLTRKIESLFGVRKFGSSAEYTENIQFPQNFISDVIVELPKIIAHFENIAQQLKEIIQSAVSSEMSSDDTTEQFSDDLFSEKATLVKVCFGLCLRLIAALFTWPGFENQDNAELLKHALKAVAGETNCSNSDARTVNELTIAAMKYISRNHEITSDLHSALYMFTFAQTLVKHVPSKESYATEVFPLCSEFLKRKWYAFDGKEMQGAECNALIEHLLRGFFRDVKFSSIKVNLQWMKTELLDLKDRGGCLPTFPCIKLVNFPVLYRHIMTGFIDMMHRKLDKNAQLMNQLKIWKNSSDLLDLFLDIAKKIDMPRVFAIYLKNTLAYLKLLMQHGMSTIELNLNRKSDNVLELLRTLQNSTRFIHCLCCQSKAVKDSAIISMIPSLRETLTQLVYKVQAALAANKCSSVFWTGPLKNKDINGDDILSQATSITRSTLSSDPYRMEVENEGANDEPGPSKGKRSSKPGPKSRRLRSVAYEPEEDAPNEDSSRSRCF